MSKRNKPTQKNNRKIGQPVRLLEAGTILYSVSDYNGLILEYQLGKNDEVYELYLFIKMNDFSEDYVFGLKLDKEIKKDDIEQRIYRGDSKEIVYRVPKVSKNVVFLVDGTKNVVKPGVVSAAKVKLHRHDLKSLEFWVSAKGYEAMEYLPGEEKPRMLKIPNLIHFDPPLLGAKMNEAYPEFSGVNSPEEWWRRPNADKLNLELRNPLVHWSDGKRKDGKTEPAAPIKVASYQTLSENLKLLGTKLKDPELNPDYERLGYWFTVNNAGPQVRVYVSSNQNLLYSFKVPEKKNHFKHFIGCWSGLQLRLNGFDGPVLTETSPGLVAIDYLETRVGVWLHLSNYTPAEVEFRVTSHHQGSGEETYSRVVYVEEQTQHKELYSVEETGVTLFRVYLVRDGLQQLVSQYRLNRLEQPSVTLEPLEMSNGDKPRRMKISLSKTPSESNEDSEEKEEEFIPGEGDLDLDDREELEDPNNLDDVDEEEEEDKDEDFEPEPELEDQNSEPVSEEPEPESELEPESEPEPEPSPPARKLKLSLKKRN